MLPPPLPKAPRSTAQTVRQPRMCPASMPPPAPAKRASSFTDGFGGEFRAAYGGEIAGAVPVQAGGEGGGLLRGVLTEEEKGAVKQAGED